MTRLRLPQLRRRPRHGATATQPRSGDIHDLARVQPMPFDLRPPTDLRGAERRVETLVDSLLPHGIDEGTGAALDALTVSWVAGWLATVDAEHLDHDAVVDRLIGCAEAELAGVEALHEHAARQLRLATVDVDAARDRVGAALSPATAP